MSVKLLTEHHLEFLSLKGGCTGLSEATMLEITCCGSVEESSTCHQGFACLRPTRERMFFFLSKTLYMLINGSTQNDWTLLKIC